MAAVDAAAAADAAAGSPAPGGEAGAPAQGTGEKIRGWKRFLQVSQFLSYLAYVQSACVASLAVLPLGADTSHGIIAAHCLWVAGTRYSTSRTSRPRLDDRKQPVIYLCNHRSWGDFIVDAALMHGSSFIARRMVVAAVPISALWGWLTGWLWLFDRRVKHPEGSSMWMRNFIESSHKNFPYKGVVLYPEGTRTLDPEGLPPRPGGLAAAYMLGWPVQVVITSDKEHVLGERTLSLGVGQQINSCLSEPVYPQDFASADEFVARVLVLWRETWAKAYSLEDRVERTTAALPVGAAPASDALEGPRSRL